MTTRTINIGNTQIGGSHPIAVQTMWKNKLSFSDIESAKNQIDKLSEMGCALLRFAVPDLEAAEILGELAECTEMPLAADIHFDYKLALKCMDYPIAKIRINPGNIGSKEKTARVLEKAASKNIPIRIGVNAGSLPMDLRKQTENGLKTAHALAQAAEREIAVFREFGFDNYLVSMKASNIADTIEANRILSQTGVPLHLGVTEAGPLAEGVAASTAALVPLLTEGIGDTIRVSLSDTMENEIIAGFGIIRAAKEITEMEGGENGRLKCSSVRIISCPRCGRHSFDTHAFTDRWMHKLYRTFGTHPDKNITIAVMGCEVNGPEEAKHADIGITGAGDKVLIFKKGQIIKTINAEDADKIFLEELIQLAMSN